MKSGLWTSVFRRTVRLLPNLLLDLLVDIKDAPFIFDGYHLFVTLDFVRELGVNIERFLAGIAWVWCNRPNIWKFLPVNLGSFLQLTLLIIEVILRNYVRWTLDICIMLPLLVTRFTQENVFAQEQFFLLLLIGAHILLFNCLVDARHLLVEIVYAVFLCALPASKRLLFVYKSSLKMRFGPHRINF